MVALPALSINMPQEPRSPLDWNQLQRSVQTGYDFGTDMQRRNLLKEVGASAATGNYLEAAQRAMRGGDLDTGLALQKHSQSMGAADTDRKLKLLDFFGRGAQAADTPEKWQALINMAQGVYGPSYDVTPFSDFSRRDQVISFLSDSKSALERQKLQVELELNREKLAGAREERGMTRDVLSSFGFMPSGAGMSPYASPSMPSSAPSMSPSGNVGMGQQAPGPTAQPSTQDIIAKMSPTQRSALGLLLAKKDYSGAVKLLQEASGDPEGKPPSGYRWSTQRPGELEAISGGPASKLPSDVAGKVGMMRVAVANMPRIRDIFLGAEGDKDPKTGKKPRKGANVGMVDYYATAGEIGEGIRLTTGAIESVLRAASGAAVPEQEVSRYQGLFMPSPYDTEVTKQRKLDALENWIGTMLATIQEGRPVPLDEAHRMAQGTQGQARPSGRLQAGPNAPAGAQGQIPPDAVRELLSDPSPDAMREFEEVFGPGSANQFIGR
jgi:hypothetical protein